MPSPRGGSECECGQQQHDGEGRHRVADNSSEGCETKVGGGELSNENACADDQHRHVENVLAEETSRLEAELPADAGDPVTQSGTVRDGWDFYFMVTGDAQCVGKHGEQLCKTALDANCDGIYRPPLPAGTDMNS